MKAGIITFHGSHNYGSVLQAYATQQTLLRFGIENEIINFRMKSQEDYYSLYPLGFGKMLAGQALLMFPFHKKRMARWRKFESFILKRLRLSGPALQNRADLEAVSDCYDLYLCGSDQIWSNRIPELACAKEDFTGVYFLDFVSPEKKKLAYASSVGEITYDELISKKELLQGFLGISTREQYGVDLLERVTGKKPELVLDPTFLLRGRDWRRMAGASRKVEEPYLLLYTLRGLKRGLKWGKELSRFAKRQGLKFVAVSPFFPIVNGADNIMDAGPSEFLNLLANAEVVFTDSFHGTALSVNLGKPFYSFIGKNTGDNRKAGVLEQLGLMDRALESLEEIAEIDDYGMDYAAAEERLDGLRSHSLNWLGHALEDAASAGTE